MKQFKETNYYIHEGEVFKKINPQTRNKLPQYLLTNSEHKRIWIPKSALIKYENS